MDLFTDEPAPDPAYANIRDAHAGWLAECREHCERLWERFEPYADMHFLEQAGRDFQARYWEMYLAVSLLDMGFDITCPKPGPDVGILHEGRRIWFEAVCPQPGDERNPDRIEAPELGRAYWVPNPRMVMRYLGAIRAKYLEQYAGWVGGGTVAQDDCFVIAINPRQLHFEHADTEPPRILQAALPLGDRYVTFDQDTLEVTGGGHQFRAALQRASGAEVPTAAFFNPDYPGLSGLLCSRVDPANWPARLGEDFQLVPNPLSRSPLPNLLRLRGAHFTVEVAGDEVRVTRELEQRQ